MPPSSPFKNENYWRRPVPGFGDPLARLFILGLAPALQGGNRTGRIFTGDQTAKFLMRALYEEGFASQPSSESADDDLRLKDCYLSAAVKCVPPKHKPLPSEFFNCSRYLKNEIFLLKNMTCILALGRDAFNAYLKFLKKEAGVQERHPRFSHGGKVEPEGWPTLYASYHPTPRNVNTGLLTTKMFSDLLKRIKKENLCA